MGRSGEEAGDLGVNWNHAAPPMHSRRTPRLPGIHGESTYAHAHREGPVFTLACKIR